VNDNSASLDNQVYFLVVDPYAMCERGTRPKKTKIIQVPHHSAAIHFSGNVRFGLGFRNVCVQVQRISPADLNRGF
jgi:hypothetical protein